LIQKKRGEQAFAAAGVYLLLLQIPGSMAYNIFHPLLFRGVLNLLKSWQTQPGTLAAALCARAEVVVVRAVDSPRPNWHGSALLGAAKSPKAKKGKAKAGSQRKGKRAQAKEEFEDLEADEDGVRGCHLMSGPSLASERALSHAVPFYVQELGHENEEGINKRVVFILEELQTFLEGYTEMHQVLLASS
jgi:hypothetical protein